MNRGTVWSNVSTYGSVGALGGQPPRATRQFTASESEKERNRQKFTDIPLVIAIPRRTAKAAAREEQRNSRRRTIRRERRKMAERNMLFIFLSPIFLSIPVPAGRLPDAIFCPTAYSRTFFCRKLFWVYCGSGSPACRLDSPRWVRRENEDKRSVAIFFRLGGFFLQLWPPRATDQPENTGRKQHRG